MIDTNAIIDAAFAAPEAQPQADAAIDPKATQDTPEADPSEAQPTEAKPEEMFPKKAVNAISRRDKMIGKLRAELAAARAQQPVKPEVVNGIPKTLPNGEPNPEAYSNYDDLTQARIEHRADQKIIEHSTKQKESQITEMETEWRAERNAAIDSDAEAFVKENPEFADLMNRNAQVIKSAPQEIKDLFLEAEQPLVALLNLAKAGKLAEIANMTPTQAAREIGRAEAQAISKPQSKAPAPLSASRGSVAGGKKPEDLSGDEIRSWMKS